MKRAEEIMAMARLGWGWEDIVAMIQRDEPLTTAERNIIRRYVLRLSKLTKRYGQ
jgi:hypothetical protein